MIIGECPKCGRDDYNAKTKVCLTCSPESHCSVSDLETRLVEKLEAALVRGKGLRLTLQDVSVMLLVMKERK